MSKQDTKDAAGLRQWMSQARGRADDDADEHVADLLHKRECVRAEEAQINRELSEIANLRAKVEAELAEVARGQASL
jgi:hypothetical protein